VAASAPHRQRTIEVPVAVHRRRAIVLGALAVFQFWLWGTRLVNLARDADAFSAAFIGVHVALYLAAIGAGVVLAVMGWRLWREAGGRRP